jgi:hypothetical protein
VIFVNQFVKVKVIFVNQFVKVKVIFVNQFVKVKVIFVILSVICHLTEKVNSTHN